MDRCWILVGMMGAGKSSVGRALAKASGREFVDTDILLQNRFGRPVHQIFEVYGEETFRQHETSVLRGLQPGPYVLATGGGVVMRDANWAELRRIGLVIYLKADAEALIDRLGRSKKRRPLLQVDDWQEIVRVKLNAREAMYEKADVIVKIADEDVSEVAARVLTAIAEFRAA